MFNKTVYDYYGRGYYISQGAAPAGQCLDFLDVTYARQFVLKLKCSRSELAAMVNSVSSMPYSGPDACVDSLAQLLCKGGLHVCDISAFEHLKSSGKANYKRANGGAAISILPAALAASGAATASEQFANAEKAQALIDELQITDEDAQALLTELKVPAASTEVPPKQALVQSIADGELVVNEQLPRLSAATSDSSAAEEPQAASNTAGNRRADTVTPETPAPLVQEPAEEEDPECKLTKLTVMCAHDGRKQVVTEKTGTTLELDVVASETSKRGFEKIKATVDTSSPCGDHTQTSSSIFPAPKKTEIGSLENTYHLACNKISNPFKILWLPSISPARYNIAAKACDRFRPAAINVNVFPKVSWSASVSYGLGSAEAASGNPLAPYSYENKAAAFKGKVEYNYDEKKEDLALTYKGEINQVLNKLDWVKAKLDYFLRKLSDGNSPVQIEVSWPSFSLTYKAALEEDKAKPVVKTTHELVFTAAPLLGLKGTVDLFPVLLKASKGNPAAAPIVAILEAAMEGVGSDDSVASLKADISLKFSIGTAVNINFSAKGSNGEDDTEVKSEQSLNMEFQLEGTVGAKGHVWVIKFEKNYKAGIKTGFVGKVVITRDEVGYYWYSRFLFNGLVVYFTSYEKIEKNITNEEDVLGDLGSTPDEIENSSTHEWTWIEPDPDEESKSDTSTDLGTDAAQQNNRHYLIKF